MTQWHCTNDTATQQHATHLYMPTELYDTLNPTAHWIKDINIGRIANSGLIIIDFSLLTHLTQDGNAIHHGIGSSHSSQ